MTIFIFLLIPDPPLLVITVMKKEIQNVIQLINITIAIVFFRYWKKFNKHIKHCSGRPSFVYTFQDENLECCENYIKHKKDFSFAVVGDLETTTGYISGIEGGSVFATSYCLMLNFHPKLKMTPITCLSSFGQNEEELKNITIPEKCWPYINKGDLKCFVDACETVLEKKQKQAISTLCMIEMWMVYKCLKYYFDTVVKVNNYQLTQEEKGDFHIFVDLKTKTFFIAIFANFL